MTSKSRIEAAYEALNNQRQVADWSATEVFQFLLGEGLSEEEARELTRACRPDDEF